MLENTHRHFLNKTITGILEGKHYGKVLDVGSRHQPYKSIIKFKEYFTLDLDPKQKPNFLVDAQTFKGVPKNSFNLVMATELLEHCQNPFKVINNIHSALKKNGTAIVSMPSLYNDHSEKGIRDYYRYMEDSGYEMFKEFRKVKVYRVGSTMSASITMLGNQWKLLRLLFFFNPLLKFGKKGYTGIVVEAKK